MTRRMCPVPGCWHAIARNKIMCPEHWLRVPAWLRARLQDEYDEWRRTGFVPKAYPGNVRQALLAAGGSRLPDPAQRELF